MSNRQEKKNFRNCKIEKNGGFIPFIVAMTPTLETSSIRAGKNAAQRDLNPGVPL